MAFLAVLKSQASIVNLSIGDLIINVAYPIRAMKNVETKFGISVSCVLDDIAGGRTINVFLPKAIQMNELDISEYNMNVVPRVCLVYKGLNRRSFIIDFE